jgi:dihydroorotate dehydrogenase electron transfer subunit
MRVPAELPGPPRQLAAPVVSLEPAGVYHRLTVHAPHIAAHARPGQFVAVAVGGPDTSMLLRRALSLHRVDPTHGTVQVVFAIAGRGTRWLANVRPDDVLDVVGPLGQPFTLPTSTGKPAGHALLVGGGYGAAPLLWLAEKLAAAGHRVDLALGAATADRLCGVDAARAATGTSLTGVYITTDDGSEGIAGRVTAALPQALATGARTVYACGPMPMLAAVAAQAAAAGAVCQVAVEESMACGIGVCMTCVLPAIGDDGVARMVRSCVEGPVFDADRIRLQWPP